MTDQCNHCSYKGDLVACKATECSKHEDWYPRQLQKELDDLKASIPHLISGAIHEALVKFGPTDGYYAVYLSDHLEEFADRLLEGKER